jgi:ribonuclease HI
MYASAPHFLLFADSGPSSSRPSDPPRWRFVLESVDGSERMEAEDAEPDTPGERLDLMALVRGLEALDQPSRITLVTTSRYVRRGLAYGLNEWRAANWRWESYGRMVPVKHADLWRRVDHALRFHQLQCRSWRFDEPHAMGAPAASRVRAGWRRRWGRLLGRLRQWLPARTGGRGCPAMSG